MAARSDPPEGPSLTRHLYRFFDLLLLERSLDLEACYPDNRRSGESGRSRPILPTRDALRPTPSCSRCLSSPVNVRKLLNLGQRRT